MAHAGCGHLAEGADSRCAAVPANDWLAGNHVPDLQLGGNGTTWPTAAATGDR
jgi:hypothetical protein